MPFDPAKYLQTFGWDKGKGLGKNGMQSWIFAAHRQSVTRPLARNCLSDLTRSATLGI
jgi:hypothetical protein